MARNAAYDRSGRVPPGQCVVDKWPVLSYGATPHTPLEDWDFRLFGLVEEPVRINYQQFCALPTSRVESDFHCVTTWSMLDNTWQGVLAHDLVSLVQLKPQARYVMIHAEEGYTANLSLDDFLQDSVLFAHTHNGQQIDPDHGWPVRLIVPQLYGWKSAKWVRGVEFLSENERGFWEVRGYHIRGNSWMQERYSDEEEDFED